MAYNSGVQRTTANPGWETPQWLFDYWASRFAFDIDVCATKDTAKCRDYFTPANDALSQDWSKFGTCWMNPPYGLAIAKWCQKAADEADRGAVVVGLLPARTDTSWWHEQVTRASEVYFLRGRVKFVGAKYTAPFPNAVVVWTGVPPLKIHCLDLRNYR